MHLPISIKDPAFVSVCRRLACAATLLALIASAAAQQPQTAAPDPSSSAQPPAAMQDYALCPGDVIKISVFQNPDLLLETRVSENGTITYPLIGTVPVGGSSTSMAEKRIASMLKEGNFLVDPQVQVTVLIKQIHGNQVAPLGQFNFSTSPADYPQFYIYGEVQRPGSYRVERNMTLIQAVAAGGGLTPRGTQRELRVKRKDACQIVEIKPGLDEPVKPDDVVYVQESFD
jgi:polysaccharide export outer membrane protein